MINKLKQAVLLEGGIIYDPYKNKKVKGSLLIQDGLVKEVGDIAPTKNVTKVNCRGKLISPGFIDIHAHFREPGREDKETLTTGARGNFGWFYPRMRHAQYQPATGFTGSYSFYNREVCRFAG